MDRSEALTAHTVVNQWPQEELRRILWQYGEERYAPQIAAAIVRRRAESPIATTELVDTIRSAMPAQACGRSSTRPSGASSHPHRRQRRAIRRGPDAPGGGARSRRGDGCA